MTDFVSRRAFLTALSAGSVAAPLAAASTTYPASSVPVTSRDLWTWMRAQVLVDTGVTWLDSARFGPALRAVLSREFRNRERQSLDPVAFEDSMLGSDPMRTRLGVIAGFLGAVPDDLALTAGTFDGLSMVAHGLDLQPGDEVLTTTHDHPSAVYPWLLEARRRGIKVVQLPQPGVPESPESIVARFAGALNPRTRVMLFSHVQCTDGTVMPARELCAMARANNVFSVVDGAQGCGLLDLALATLGCDVYATSFHKWLGGAHGTGALFVRAEARARLWPSAVERPTGWDLADRYGTSPPVLSTPADLWPMAQAKFGHASRYLASSLDAAPIAIELQQAVNRARIGARQRELAVYLRLKLGELPGIVPLTPTHPALWTAIQSFALPGRDHGAIVAALAAEDRIFVSHVRQGAVFDAIRASVHAWNDHADIDRFANALRRRL